MKKPLSFSDEKSNGFTLIEIIVTLVIAAILGTFLVAFMGTALTKSGEPVARSKQLYELQQVLENIKGTYLTMADATDALNRLQTYATGGTGGTTSQNFGNYTVTTKRISFSQVTGGNYAENSTACTGSDCALKVTVTSNLTQGLNVTEVFTQRP